MANICVIYASENKEIVKKLVILLKKSWDVWWDDHINQGDWEKIVRTQIVGASAVVAVFSSISHKKDRFLDELEFAKESGKLIFPFLIEEADIPFGFRKLNRTYALGWNGVENDPGYRVLKQKLINELGSNKVNDALKRMLKIEVNSKILKLPCFVFSLSSHETQIPPHKGIRLMQLFKPAASLVSAYDIWDSYTDTDKDKKNFVRYIHELKATNSVLFLDSGNYEAYRKNDLYPSKEKGWQQEKFHKVLNDVSPDIAFAFDQPNPTGEIDDIAESVIRSFEIDYNAVNGKVLLCPIIHLPVTINRTQEKLSFYASQLIVKVASKLDPFMIAIPERELGSGIIEIFRTVQYIRKELNKLGKYYPLHLLGTGNPISIYALASAGADSFDGLEWCRTVADYNDGRLYHFQHFDCFSDTYSTRLQSQEIRSIVNNRENPYVIRAASYNIDVFNDWIKTMQDMIETGNVRYLLKTVPHISTQLLEGLDK